MWLPKGCSRAGLDPLLLEADDKDGARDPMIVVINSAVIRTLVAMACASFVVQPLSVQTDRVMAPMMLACVAIITCRVLAP